MATANRAILHTIPTSGKAVFTTTKITSNISRRIMFLIFLIGRSSFPTSSTGALSKHDSPYNKAPVALSHPIYQGFSLFFGSFRSKSVETAFIGARWHVHPALKIKEPGKKVYSLPAFRRSIGNVVKMNSADVMCEVFGRDTQLQNRSHRARWG